MQYYLHTVQFSYPGVQGEPVSRAEVKKRRNSGGVKRKRKREEEHRGEGRGEEEG